MRHLLRSILAPVLIMLALCAAPVQRAEATNYYLTPTFTENWDSVTAPAIPSTNWNVYPSTGSSISTTASGTPLSSPNQVVTVAGGGSSFLINKNIMASGDGYAENVIKFSAPQTTQSIAEIGIRLSSNSSTASVNGYSVRYACISGTTTSKLIMAKWTSGTESTLGSSLLFTNPGTVVNVLVRIIASGSNLVAQVYRYDTSQWLNSSGVWVTDATNQTHALDLTDTSYSAAGYTMVGCSTNTVQSVYSDNFASGTVSTSAPALTAGTLSIPSSSSTSASWSSTAPANGTAPITEQLYRSTTSGFTPGVGNQVSGATTLTGTDSPLTTGTAYYYVMGYTDSSATPVTVYSNQVSVTPTATALVAGSASVVVASSTSATVTEVAPSGGTGPYSRNLQIAADSAGSPGTFSDVSGATTTPYTNTGLTTGTKVWYRWRQVDSSGTPQTVYTSAVSVTPTALVAGTVSTSSVTGTTLTVSTTAGTGGTGTGLLYLFYRAPDNAGSPGTFASIGSASSSTSYNDTALTNSTKYWYEVVVTDSGNDTVTSSPVSVTTTSSGVTLLPNNSAIIYSPANWAISSSHAITIYGGAYFRLDVSNTASVTLNFNTTNLTQTPYPQLRYRWGSQAWTDVTLASSITLNTPSGAMAPWETLEVVFKFKSTGLTNNQRWIGIDDEDLTSITMPAGALYRQPYLRPKTIIVFGDSLSEGAKREVISGSAVDCAPSSWAYLLGQKLNAEVGMCALSGSGLTTIANSAIAVAGTTYWDAVYNPTWPATGQPSNLDSGEVPKTFPSTCDLIIFGWGFNDSLSTAAEYSAYNTLIPSILAKFSNTPKMLFWQAWNGNTSSAALPLVAANWPGSGYVATAYDASTNPNGVIWNAGSQTVDLFDGTHPVDSVDLRKLVPLIGTAAQTLLYPTGGTTISGTKRKVQ